MNEKVFSMIEDYLKEDGWKYIADLENLNGLCMRHFCCLL